MDEKTFKHLLEKIEKAKEKGQIDLSADEDLSLAVMNLVSLEEHFFFTGAKTGKNDFYDLSNDVREIRKELMHKLLPAAPGETWCAVKHLLATTMRLVEVAQKLRRDGKREESDKTFSQAYKVYAIFWSLKLGLADVREFKNRLANDAPLSLEDLVTKLADCCNE